MLWFSRFDGDGVTAGDHGNTGLCGDTERVSARNHHSGATARGGDGRCCGTVVRRGSTCGALGTDLL